AVPVELAGGDVGQVAVPHLVGLLEHRHPLRLARRVGLEEAQLDLGGALGEEGEVDARPVPGGPERVRATGPDAHGCVLGEVDPGAARATTGRRAALFAPTSAPTSYRPPQAGGVCEPGDHDGDVVRP